MMDATFVEAPKRGANPDVDAVAQIVVKTADRLAAFRLRYEAYIAKQGKPYPEADHGGVTPRKPVFRCGADSA